jgi:hypothetical protein
MSARKATATVPVPLAPAKSSSKVVAKAAPAIESARNAVVDSHRPKAKLVRDSFTIPKSEYSVLEGLKVRAANLTRPVKKSELLRAGIAVLSAMSDKAFLAALDGVPSLKTGRPKGPDTISAPAKGPK